MESKKIISTRAIFVEIAEPQLLPSDTLGWDATQPQQRIMAACDPWPSAKERYRFGNHHRTPHTRFGLLSTPLRSRANREAKLTRVHDGDAFSSFEVLNALQGSQGRYFQGDNATIASYVFAFQQSMPWHESINTQSLLFMFPSHFLSVIQSITSSGVTALPHLSHVDHHLPSQHCLSTSSIIAITAQSL